MVTESGALSPGRSGSGSDMDSEEADSDSGHVCLRCRATFARLREYVRHRKSRVCRKKPPTATEAAGRKEKRPRPASTSESAGQAAQGGGGGGVLSGAEAAPSPSSASSGESSLPQPEPAALSSAGAPPIHNEHHSLVVAGPARPKSDLASPEDGSGPDAEAAAPSAIQPPPRLRRPSSDQATTFMESLGLHVNTKTVGMANKEPAEASPRSRNLLLSPRSSGQANTAECWDDHSLLTEISRWSNEMSLLTTVSPTAALPAAPKSHATGGGGGGGKPSLMSFVKQKSRMDDECSKSLMFSPTQTDFLRQINLMNVSNVGVEMPDEHTSEMSGGDAAIVGATSLAAARERQSNSREGGPFQLAATIRSSPRHPGVLHESDDVLQQPTSSSSRPGRLLDLDGSSSLLGCHQSVLSSPQPSSSAGGANAHAASNSNSRWRLWNPEHDVGFGGTDELWSDVLDLETSCNDPTLMEVAVAANSIGSNAINNGDGTDVGFKNQSSPPLATTTITRATPGALEETEKSLQEDDEKQQVKLEQADSERFFCRACDRSLASRELFERHKLSELHFKRAASSEVAPSALATATASPARPEFRIRKPNARYLDKEEESKGAGEKGQRSRNNESDVTSGDPITCESCHAQVNPLQYGKHLISHFHHHRSKLPHNHPISQQLVLRHIGDIVKLAPFQCDICHFYCNWHQDFVDHWRSARHQDHVDEGGGDANGDANTSLSFWCSFCGFRCDRHSDMLTHLLGNKHSEIVVAIGRHVPIAIRRVQLSQCSLCQRRYRLKVALRRHMRKQHGQEEYQLPDHSRLACEHCHFKTFSQKSLTAHSFLAHPSHLPKYTCRPCRLRFDSKRQSEKHRTSLAHRLTVRAARHEDLRVACEFCGVSASLLSDLQSLKEHVVSAHPRHLRQCGLCGDRFALSQDLSAHARGARCWPRGLKVKASLACDGDEGECDFTCDGVNMMLFHKSLRHGTENEEKRFFCVVCQKSLGSKSKLWEHVLVHGQAHRCTHCYRIFESDEKLHQHQRLAGHSSARHEEEEGRQLSCPLCDFTTTKRKLLQLHDTRTHFQATKCPECRETFFTFSSYRSHVKSHIASGAQRHHACDLCPYSAKTASDLKKHLVVHDASAPALKCDLCDFSCRRASELKRHRQRKHPCKSDPDPRRFRCPAPDCRYSAVSRQHLQRHSLTHDRTQMSGPATNTRPCYQCKLCSYSCPSLDNLRKHILKTNKHPGASVYVCQHCDAFETNSAATYEKHVSEKHSDKYGTPFLVRKHLKDYFLPKKLERVKGKKGNVKK